MKLEVYYGASKILDVTTISGHKKLVSGPGVVALTPLPDAQVVSFSDSGNPQVDSNGEVEVDANDEIVWETPPALQVEFESSVSVNGATTTYTYRMRNVTDEDRTFSVPEVTAPAFPGGWTGTVVAQDTEELSFAVVGESTYLQLADVSLSASDYGGVFRQGADVFVPESRVSYEGTVVINSITYNSSTGANDVVFAVSAQSGTQAVLWRVESSGDLALVAVEEGNFSTTGSHTISDSGYEPGALNTYVVEVGIEPNGHSSDEASVQN